MDAICSLFSSGAAKYPIKQYSLSFHYIEGYVEILAFIEFARFSLRFWGGGYEHMVNFVIMVLRNQYCVICDLEPPE